MKVWMVRDLDPLPTDEGGRRLLRSGYLSRALADAGHEVTWITSNFDHYRHTLRPLPTGPVAVSDGLSIVTLKGLGYDRNIGMARVRHNHHFAASFANFARRARVRPELILTDIPTTETAAVVIGLASELRIPSVLSIRDPWPDSFANHIPPLLRPLGPIIAEPFRRQAAFACRNATSLVGISSGYLDWALAKAGRVKGPLDAVYPLSYRRAQAPDPADIQRQLDAWSIGLSDRVVAFVGSWGSSIDLDLLGEVARQLSARPDIRIVVTGDASRHSQRELDRLANVTTTGWIDATQVAVLLDRAEVGLLPYVESASQGLPNKFFEYMAHGCYQIGTLRGEITGHYARTGIGRSVPSDPGLVAAAVLERLDGSGIPTREAIASEFASRYSPGQVYGDMVSHVEDVAQAGAEPSSDRPTSAAAIRRARDLPPAELECRHLSEDVEASVRAWFRGEIDRFTPDGERSVRIAHPSRPGTELKIKGAGFMGREIRFDRRQRSGPKAPVFDFEGRMMEDVAAGHDNAFLGGASFQQAANEYAIGKRFAAIGYPVVPVLGYGSVSRGGLTSWFSVHEWETGLESVSPPRASLAEYSELNLVNGRQTLELATEHGLIGYFWYVSKQPGRYLCKDLHPFRHADPINMSRISWAMQVLFALNIRAESVAHFAQRATGEVVPEDIFLLPFRAILPDLTIAEHGVLRGQLFAPFMRRRPEDFEPVALSRFLRSHRLTAALLDRCPEAYVDP